ncbi:Putative O-glycosylation ligase, exosortase A system-associated [Rubrivivax sp. A210]|uniref:putative O-glycosylation ligase, exosortase A system-associated n=1 Tax=Rubrivivax sp. A210 TaxID=2772301 RepID=UPI00191B680E|nr:putative O-glycosylation ligase, exosortase A system-associated [Rubrivivax sp. A210]CAD5375215.1 Putative O-glycosylation ligase, exosortase A system-associated [Rubrivivax sp. A210]
MKDALILLLLVGVSLWALREPWIGVMAWTLVSLGSPHVEFGHAAAYWPVASGIAICTLLGLLVTKDKVNPMYGAAPWWLLGLAVWICITLPASLYFDASYRLWERTVKTFLFIFVTLAVVTDERKLKVFIWINVVAIAFYGVKGGVFTILSGGNYRVWGPGGFIEGNNEVGLAVITVVPLMRYLHLQMTDSRAKLVMAAAMGLCVATVLGTHSRGALLGVAAMGLVLWQRGQNKILWGVVLVFMAMAALSLMPEHWWSRMNTIKTYEADGSAMGRINAWWMAFNLAKQNIFGGGFMIYNAEVFARYAPVPDDVHAAHSIYFQILGEHGFIGFFLWLAIGVSTWWTAQGLIKDGRRHPQIKWAADLGAMVQVSMVGYAVTGAFLSLTYYDLPYNVMVMAAVGRRLASRRMAALQAHAAPVAAGRPPAPAPRPQVRHGH